MSKDFGLDIGEAMWLANPKHAHFKYRPATIREFCGADYLDIAQSVRPGVMEALIDVFGETLDPLLISRCREAMVTGGIGIGKCCTLDSMINVSDGSYRRARDIRPGDRVPGGVVAASESNGTKPVYRVGTSWGQTLELTENHPVWVEGSGWTEVQDLKEGDKLQVLTGWEAENPEDLDPDMYRLAGYMIADGSLTNSTPSWCKGNEYLEDDMARICENLGWDMNVKYDKGTHRGYSLVSGGAARKLFTEWKIMGKLSSEKRVPDFVFRSSNRMIENFLCSYLESDGHCGEYTIEFYSVNRDLLCDVQKLLLRLGIASMVKLKNGRYKGEVHKSWRLSVPAAGWNKIRAWSFVDRSRMPKSFDYVDPATIPLGLCGCGCGEKTHVPPKNNRSKGLVKGVPVRFRRGHSNRARPEVLNPSCTVEFVKYKGDEETWSIQVEPTKHLYIDDILTHNTTLASIALPYMVHWVQCLSDPQGFYGLMSGSRIAFMMMSTSERQAKDVLFDDVKARIDNSPWFKQYSPRDTKFDTRIKFPNDIFIIPGGSEETQFEGYNILGGILDEGDSHKSTARKNYAMEGWNTISSRISSRFTNPSLGCHMGLILAIGQKKSGEGFMAKKSEDLKVKSDATVVTMTIWESLGWYNFTDNPSDAVIRQETGERKSFYFDTMRKEILPKDDVPDDLRSAPHMIEVPMAYFSDFLNDPVKALRDLAGIPPAASDPFIPQVDRIIECYEGWHIRYGDDQPVGGKLDRPEFAEWFHATDGLVRSLHIDLAYSGDGDALGMAMGHVAELVDTGDEEKPLITFDFLLRMKARSGQEIMLSDIRKMVYDLKFNRGFNIKYVTMDGFNTTDTMQQFQKKKINAGYLSVDKSKLPYTDLREAIYERRCLFPKYMVKYHHSDNETDLTNIAYRELSQLSEGPRKIDHPANGSKDIADCMAGVVHNLMNSTQARRGAGRGGARSGADMDEAQVREALSKLSVPRAGGKLGDESYKPATFEDFLNSQRRDSGRVPHVDADSHRSSRMMF